MKSHRAGLLLMVWLLSVLAAGAEETVAVFGTEAASGSSVLAVVSLPEASFKDGGSLVPLKVTIVARGVRSPTQGENDTVLYWKGNRLWRYGQGAQKLLLEVPPFLGLGEAMETPVEPTGRKHLACIAANRISGKEMTEAQFFDKAGLNYEPSDAFFPPAKGVHREPIAWIDGKRLLAREFQYDALDRLKTSRFVIASLKEEARLTTLEVEPLTSLPESQLELRAAVHNRQIALQIYDEKTQTFRIGIQTVGGKTMDWLPAPAPFAKRLNNPVAQMAWSPDGRFLAVTFRSLETWIWNAKEQ